MVRRNGGFIGTDGLDAPDPPTGVTVTTGSESGSVAFTAPTDAGTSSITGFVAQVSTNGTDYSVGSGTGTSSPITITGLTNGTAHTAKVWAINSHGTSSPSDASSSFTPSPIALFGAADQNIYKIDFVTAADRTDFGDLSVSGRSNGAAVASSTRAVWGGGATGSLGTTIDYASFASSGNAADFGDLTVARNNLCAASNNTRGIFAGGEDSSSRSNVVDYITIGSTGDAADFGDLSAQKDNPASCSNTTRAVVGGGRTSSARINVIEYFTISSTTNSTDFGDLTNGRSGLASESSNTRGVFAGGSTGSDVNTIDYITIASTGNATDFGDLTENIGSIKASSATNKTIAIFVVSGNKFDQITIASTGNATEFGDTAAASIGADSLGGASASHGGIA